MNTDLQQWTPRPYPVRKVFEGRYVRLEPFDVAVHTEELHEASTPADAARRFTWLPEYSPDGVAEFKQWMKTTATSEDPLYFVVIDKRSGKVAGRQTLMRIDAANGVIEIGNIYWGPLIAQQRGATEALYLFASYVFDELGYRRFEWKCNNENLPSKRAAIRFGFQHEGVFRQHLIVKGLNRDTAWFGMLDKDWPALKRGYEGWLDADNFDTEGIQKHSLLHFMPAA